MMDAESRLRAEIDIRTLVSRYSDAVVRRDRVAWVDTWAVGGVWRLLGMEAKGREAIGALWERLISVYAEIVQIPNSAILEIDGTRATGRWYISEFGKLANGSSMMTIGVYHDEYTRADGSWLFASRRFDALYGSPEDLAGTFLPFPKEFDR